MAVLKSGNWLSNQPFALQQKSPGQPCRQALKNIEAMKTPMRMAIQTDRRCKISFFRRSQRLTPHKSHGWVPQGIMLAIIPRDLRLFVPHEQSGCGNPLAVVAATTPAAPIF